VALHIYALDKLVGLEWESPKAALMRCTMARLHLDHRNLVCLYGAFKVRSVGCCCWDLRASMQQLQP
jgi:hypothetical protein